MKYFQKIKEDAILRFLFTYLVILFVVFGCCTICFRKAFVIVEDNLIEETRYMFTQDAAYVERIFSEARMNGVSLSTSDALKQLGQLETGFDQKGYYPKVKNVLKIYEEVVYQTRRWNGEVFIHFPNMDRIIYSDAVYRPRLFLLRYLEPWGIAEEEWNSLCRHDEKVPFICPLEGGDIVYGFPCLKSVSGSVRLGTVFIKIGKSEILQRMTFLEKYDGFSFFIFQEGQVLVSEDQLGIGAELKEEWLQKQGSYRQGSNFIFSVCPDTDGSRQYILVIPQQEPLTRLQALRLFTWLLLLTAMTAGAVLAVYFSLRNGKPINRMTYALKDYNEDLSGYRLEELNDTVNQIVQENKKSVAALRHIFFHNLLKADFLSRAEMEYMAKRVGVELQDGTYYAAAIRFFPQVDVNGIDGITIEEARNLQALVREYLENCYPFPVWSYKRNTLVTMYIVEVGEEEELFKVLGNVIMWLSEKYHADACWGVGTPCKDLMLFWKSAEEAYSALTHNEKEEPVCLYSDTLVQEETCYMPYSMEEYLVNGLRGGDGRTVADVLSMIREENFVRRRISHRQFIKLNHNICELLADFFREIDGNEERLVNLSAKLTEKKVEEEEYFSCLNVLCQDICSYFIIQKNRKKREKVEKIIDFIQENYADPGMGLGMVSAYCKLSEGYLSAIFKEETHVNFADYLENIRIEKACELLLEGELVAVIAERTGYNSVQSFRRAFKRVKKVSPSEYKN